MEEYEMADLMKLQNGSDIRGIACEGVAGEAEIGRASCRERV